MKYEIIWKDEDRAVYFSYVYQDQKLFLEPDAFEKNRA